MLPDRCHGFMVLRLLVLPLPLPLLLQRALSPAKRNPLHWPVLYSRHVPPIFNQGSLSVGPFMSLFSTCGCRYFLKQSLVDTHTTHINVGGLLHMSLLTEGRAGVVDGMHRLFIHFLSRKVE